MRIRYAELQCGGWGTIIDCHTKLCPFCKEYVAWFWQEKDVSPLELLQLIRSYKYIIKSVST